RFHAVLSFFVQAEDGIRDRNVTGVQTCALPISVFSKIATEGYKNNAAAFVNRLDYMGLNQKIGLQIKGEGQPVITHPGDKNWYEIGRASCRGRVYSSEG